ncbi:MAG: hypothetical protein H6732_16195 [Alphaproteobacteria bacterium]|nr:hypothetical protein [Alphaproteobacteria bacterium]
MRVAVAAAALLASMPAYAGGIGPLVMGGFHTEEVAYYYSRTNSGTGARIPNQQDWEQVFDPQIIGNAGGGLELVLGDRDNLIQGVFRAFYMLDTPQLNPVGDAELLDSGAAVTAFREDIKHIGVGTVGLTFGVVRGASDRLKLAVAVHLGAGFLTNDHTEFALAQAGPNLSYLFSRTVEGYIDVSYGVRFRKTVSHGLYGSLGIRYLFD